MWGATEARTILCILRIGGIRPTQILDPALTMASYEIIAK